MATVEDWQKYINLLHELALIEDDLRTEVAAYDPNTEYTVGRSKLAKRILFERFGLNV